jgi:hypothetical protein
MFRVPTVFIVGAGAGVELGMLTGDTLRNEIATKVNVAFRGLTEKISGNDNTFEQMQRIASVQKLDVNDLMAAGRRIAKGIHYSGSIDDYIHTHQHDELVKITGKLGIVQTIVEYEKKSKLFVEANKHPIKFRDENGVRQSWLSKFMVLLQENYCTDEFKRLVPKRDDYQF